MSSAWVMRAGVVQYGAHPAVRNKRRTRGSSAALDIQIQIQIWTQIRVRAESCIDASTSCIPHLKQRHTYVGWQNTSYTLPRGCNHFYVSAW